ncbi:WD40 repeat domain-containing protein [Salinibius halmophilus]|uniref:WD40 repeat domain-containing protein n=1 Tax=Salinibius halmophilus TaxID=1853216 RepID=UPI000E6676A9|nr:hypothetical protein [Salinibius halmophilus]
MRHTFTSLFIALVLAGCNSKPLDSWQLVDNGVLTGAFSPNGQLTLIGTLYQGGAVWNSRTTNTLFRWNHQADFYTDIESVAFSADNRVALTADRYTLVSWSTETGEAFGYWRAPAEISAVALSRNGEFAFVGMEDAQISKFNALLGGVETTMFHQGPINDLAMSANSNRLISGSEDYTAKIWNSESGELLLTLPSENQVTKVAISDNGQLALTSAPSEPVLIWAIDGKRAIREINLGINAALASAVFIENDQRLLLGMRNRQVHLYDIAADNIVKTWQLPGDSAWAVNTSRDVIAVEKSGDFILALVSDGQLHLMKE